MTSPEPAGLLQLAMLFPNFAVLCFLSWPSPQPCAAGLLGWDGDGLAASPSTALSPTERSLVSTGTCSIAAHAANPTSNTKEQTPALHCTAPGPHLPQQQGGQLPPPSTEGAAAGPAPHLAPRQVPGSCPLFSLLNLRSVAGGWQRCPGAAALRPPFCICSLPSVTWVSLEAAPGCFQGKDVSPSPAGPALGKDLEGPPPAQEVSLEGLQLSVCP